MPRLTADLDSILRELGRLVFNFNSAEQSLRRLAFLLIDPTDERTGAITLDRLGANGLEELVLALAPYRLSNSDDIASRIVSAVKRFGALRIRRNNFIHAIWRVPNDAVDLSNMEAVRIQFRKGTSTKVGTRSPANIAATASEASSISEDLEDLHKEAKRAVRRHQRKKP
jgi:hypothetical protein